MAKAGAASRMTEEVRPGPPRRGGGWSRRRVATLKDSGIRRRQCPGHRRAGRANQGLIFYHFGSVTNLLLAALDAVSAERLEHYGAAVADVGLARVSWWTWPRTSSARISMPAT